jgi:hypothetical protein
MVESPSKSRVEQPHEVYTKKLGGKELFSLKSFSRDIKLCCEK